MSELTELRACRNLMTTSRSCLDDYTRIKHAMINLG
jgi:hypothetical protein